MIGIEGLDKTYRSARRTVHVIDRVHLEIPAGSFFVLVGPSGSGKTTTLRVVAGLEGHDAGRVRLDGRVVSDPASGTFVPPSGRGIGMVFQSYAIWPHMDVFENVAYPLRQGRARPDGAERARRVEEALDLVGLRIQARAPATALSGGQQQRVALARALVARPKVLLLDEPLSNLDAQLRERMRGEIRDIQQGVGITALYVTHDRAEALSMASHLAVMNNGRIEMVGTPREVYEQPTTPFVAEFLGPCNLLEGKVTTAPGPGACVVATPLGPIRCRTSGVAGPGGRVVVALRPEDVRLSAPPPGPPAGLAGRLAGMAYLGDRLECMVEVAGIRLRTLAHPAFRAGADGAVAVALPDEAGWAMPA